MKKVAIIQFPGSNSEYETARAVEAAGMKAEFFRWNRDTQDLKNFDAYIVVGGFSYEDRGRSGLIASMEPIMKELALEAEAGKPLLGICNGAQILIETGLVPSGIYGKKLMSLAHNKRVKNGELLGTGFYNENIILQSQVSRGRSAFTFDIEEKTLFTAPAAHGEGRFTTRIAGLMDALEKNGQILFKYSDENGNLSDEFPVNPNGALHNAAAICNPAGNIMAIMPHPERAPLAPMPAIFTSLRLALESGKKKFSDAELDFEPIVFEKDKLSQKTHRKNTLELFIGLLITDNEAQTIENTLRQNGSDVRIKKWRYFEISHEDGVNQEDLKNAILDAGELFNPNKEKALWRLDGDASPLSAELVFLATQLEEDMRSGTVWEVFGPENSAAVCDFNLSIFANPNDGDLTKYV